MASWWPWRRRRSVEPAAQEPVTPSAPSASAISSTDPGWRALPPLQRTVGPHRLAAPLTPFTDGLRTRYNPSFLAPLAHNISTEAPAGVVGGLVELASPLQRSPGPELLLPTRPARPTAGRSTVRYADSFGTAAAGAPSAPNVQRAAEEVSADMSPAGAQPSKSAAQLERSVDEVPSQADSEARLEEPAIEDPPGASPEPSESTELDVRSASAQPLTAWEHPAASPDRPAASSDRPTASSDAPASVPVVARMHSLADPSAAGGGHVRDATEVTEPDVLVSQVEKSPVQVPPVLQRRVGSAATRKPVELSRIGPVSEAAPSTDSADESPTRFTDAAAAALGVPQPQVQRRAPDLAITAPDAPPSPLETTSSVPSLPSTPSSPGMPGLAGGNTGPTRPAAGPSPSTSSAEEPPKADAAAAALGVPQPQLQQPQVQRRAADLAITAPDAGSAEVPVPVQHNAPPSPLETTTTTPGLPGTRGVDATPGLAGGNTTAGHSMPLPAAPAHAPSNSSVVPDHATLPVAQRTVNETATETDATRSLSPSLAANAPHELVVGIVSSAPDPEHRSDADPTPSAPTVSRQQPGFSPAAPSAPRPVMFDAEMPTAGVPSIEMNTREVAGESATTDRTTALSEPRPSFPLAPVLAATVQRGIEQTAENLATAPPALPGSDDTAPVAVRASVQREGSDGAQVPVPLAPAPPTPAPQVLAPPLAEPPVPEPPTPEPLAPEPLPGLSLSSHLATEPPPQLLSPPGQLPLAESNADYQVQRVYAAEESRELPESPLLTTRSPLLTGINSPAAAAGPPVSTHEGLERRPDSAPEVSSTTLLAPLVQRQPDAHAARGSDPVPTQPPSGFLINHQPRLPSPAETSPVLDGTAMVPIVARTLRLHSGESMSMPEPVAPPGASAREPEPQRLPLQQLISQAQSATSVGAAGFTEVVLQRDSDDSAAGITPAPAEPEAAAPPASATTPPAPVALPVAPGVPGGLPSGSQLEQLAGLLYEPISARIREELWLDRERAGLMVNLRR